LNCFEIGRYKIRRKIKEKENGKKGMQEFFELRIKSKVKRKARKQNKDVCIFENRLK